MADLLQLPAALRSWGLDVVEVTGWQDRRRPGSFDPIGVLIHHTAGPRGKDAPSLQVCIDGRRDLPGPLCQILIARSGKTYVISAGRCNHAGTGGPLQGVTDGNGQLVGIELENDGVGEPWPEWQMASAYGAAAALYQLLGPASRCWGHKEWAPGRKIDPAGIDMAEFRASVINLVNLFPRKETTVPTENPYPAETAEALELLAQHAGYVGDRKWFGPDALAALHRLKNRAEADTAAANRLLDDQLKLAARIGELQRAADDAVANREAAEAEAAALRLELQTGGRIGALLADIDAALAKARA